MWPPPPQHDYGRFYYILSAKQITVVGKHQYLQVFDVKLNKYE